MIAQLPLNIQLRDDSTLASFYPCGNDQAFKAVQEHAQGKNETLLYCWGAKGVGKSHLLQAACHAAVEQNIAAVYIPLEDSASFSPQLLQNLEKIPLICLDDIQYVCSDILWEEGLFHLFNRVHARQGRLIISSDVSPTHSSIQLPDLKSRLAWGMSYQLHELNDEQKLQALILRAHYRGLELNNTVGHFLLSRCPRNMSELFQTLEILDQASLAEQRRLTIPFVKQILRV